MRSATLLLLIAAADLLLIASCAIYDIFHDTLICCYHAMPLATLLMMPLIRRVAIQATIG